MTGHPNDFHLRMHLMGEVSYNDREAFTRLRREFTGSTFVPLGKQWKAGIRVAPEGLRHGYMDHVRQRIVGKLHDLLASDGFSTTENLIFLHMEERPPEDIYTGVTEWFFPRASPAIGDPARVDGGTHHGHTLIVDDVVWRVVKLMDEFGYPRIYRLAGFDVATGQWIYRGAR